MQLLIIIKFICFIIIVVAVTLMNSINLRIIRLNKNIIENGGTKLTYLIDFSYNVYSNHRFDYIDCTIRKFRLDK